MIINKSWFVLKYFYLKIQSYYIISGFAGLFRNVPESNKCTKWFYRFTLIEFFLTYSRPTKGFQNKGVARVV